MFFLDFVLFISKRFFVLVICFFGVTAGFSLFAQENNLINDSSKSEIIVKFKHSSKYFSAPSNGANYSSQKVIANRTAEKLFKNISIKSAKIMGAPGLGAADLSEIYKIKLPPDEKIENVLADIRKNPDIEYVEPNFSLELQDVPNDKYFELQWGLRNTGQSIDYVPGSCGSDIKAEDAWNICKGTSGIIIALIDTGIDYNHPDLAKNIWTNTSEIPGNGIDEDNNGYTDDFRGWSFFDQNDNVLDTNGHGTHCA
ncbi:MAG: S8 family serine peptidase, partial [Elusimicrobia bacterium]|nr:S8 family serine peptidase [Elusimicrobiota bacterium]